MIITSYSGHESPQRLVATSLNRGFRYPVLASFKDRLQMDGSSLHCRVLLFAGNHSRLAVSHGGICRAN